MGSIGDYQLNRKETAALTMMNESARVYGEKTLSQKALDMFNHAKDIKLNNITDVSILIDIKDIIVNQLMFDAENRYRLANVYPDLIEEADKREAAIKETAQAEGMAKVGNYFKYDMTRNQAKEKLAKLEVGREKLQDRRKQEYEAIQRANEESSLPGEYDSEAYDARMEEARVAINANMQALENSSQMRFVAVKIDDFIPRMITPIDAQPEKRTVAEMTKDTVTVLNMMRGIREGADMRLPDGEWVRVDDNLRLQDGELVEDTRPFYKREEEVQTDFFKLEDAFKSEWEAFYPPNMHVLDGEVPLQEMVKKEPIMRAYSLKARGYAQAIKGVLASYTDRRRELSKETLEKLIEDYAYMRTIEETTKVITAEVNAMEYVRLGKKMESTTPEKYVAFDKRRSMYRAEAAEKFSKRRELYFWEK